jgi:hypothetical protein
VSEDEAEDVVVVVVFQQAQSANTMQSARIIAAILLPVISLYLSQKILSDKNKP